MAGCDYVSCDLCGKRLFYDGDVEARNYMEEYSETEYIVCNKCVEKMKKRIATLEKWNKRLGGKRKC